MPTIVDSRPPNSYFKHKQPRTSRNRYIGANIRQSIEQVFNGLGGWEAMMDWAKANPTVFYSQVVPKLLPTELAESGLAGNLTIIVQRAAATPQQVVGQVSEAEELTDHTVDEAK